MNADLNTGGGGGGGTPPPTFPPPTFPVPGALGTPIGVLRPVTINPAGDQLFGNTGHTQNIRIRLNAVARKLLRGHTSLRVTATATVGTKAVTATVTLKRAAKHAKN